MSEIIVFPESGPLEVGTAIELSRQADLKDVIILGWNKDDNLYFSHSFTYNEEINWIMDIAKHSLLKRVLD